MNINDHTLMAELEAHMEQAALNFDQRLPPNPYKVGTGNWRVYDWLQDCGRITLWELHNVLKVDCARIRCDVKPYLRQHGLDIECEYVRAGLTEYRVI